MAKIDVLKVETGLLLAFTVYFLFAATNINQTLGLIFGLFTLASAVFIILDPSRSIKIRKKNDSLLRSIAIGAGAYVAFIVLASFVLVPTVNAVIDLLGATTPVLSDSVFFNRLSFGVGVPFAETIFFFVVALDVLATIFGIQLNKRGIGKIGLWILILGISFVFMFFHLTAKGITNAEVLVMVFFMAVVSMLLVVWEESGEAALMFHIIANLSALLL